MSESNSASIASTQSSVRRLPRSLRKANVVYQFLMGLLSGTSFFLASLNASSEINISPLYFQIVSVLASAVPIVWSKFLDAMKDYEQELTPHSTPQVTLEHPVYNGDSNYGDPVHTTRSEP